MMVRRRFVHLVIMPVQNARDRLSVTVKDARTPLINTSCLDQLVVIQYFNLLVINCPVGYVGNTALDTC